MSKRILLAVLCLLVCFLLTGCGNSGDQFEDISNQMEVDPLTALQLSSQNVTEDTYNFGWTDEEDYAYVDEVSTVNYGYAASEKQYAGATPIPLAPIDMPTPTPKPTLVFTYANVSFDSLGIKFDAPSGWNAYVDGDTIVLTDPNTYDGINAEITIVKSNVGGLYTLADAKTELEDTVRSIGQYYTKWDTYSIEKRTLLGKDGYYTDYVGTTADGVQVWGRVMIALLDNNQTLTVRIAAPNGFGYKNVITKIRDTLKSL